MPRTISITAGVLGSALVLFACTMESPTSPDLDGPDLHKRHGDDSRIKICHVSKSRSWGHHKWWGKWGHKSWGRYKREPRYREIWIKARHERWHRSHGDGQIGEEMPRKHGYVFGPHCKPERAKGSLTVIKSADAAGTFDFEGSPKIGEFQLTTGDGGVNEMTFEHLRTKYDYTILEIAQPGFTLASATCTLEDGTSTGEADELGVRDIEVEHGKTTTCTFVNESDQAPETGSLRVVKMSDESGTFTFEGSSPIGTFTLDTGDPSTSEELFEGLDPAITYSVDEAANPDFTLESVTCTLANSDPTGTSGTTGVSDIVVEAGQTTTCTFENAAVQVAGGSLIVVKTSNEPGVFDYVGEPGIGSFQLDTGDPSTSQQTFEDLEPGNAYSIVENLGPDFMLISASCTLSDAPTGTRAGNGITGIVIEAGQTTSCSFVNVSVPQTGSLQIIKSSNAPGTFTFSGSPTIGTFMLSPTETTDAETTFTDLDAETTYTVTEAEDPGFTLESAICMLEDGTPTGTVDGTGVTGIQIEVNMTTTCTFVNAAVPTVAILQVVASSDGAGVFEFVGEPTIGEFELDTSAPATSSMSFEITDVAVTYSITQTVNPLFDFLGAECTLDGTPTGTLTETTVSGIEVQLGSTTTCTFTNASPPVGPPWSGQTGGL